MPPTDFEMEIASVENEDGSVNGDDVRRLISHAHACGAAFSESAARARLRELEGALKKAEMQYRCYACKQVFDEDHGHGLARDHFGDVFRNPLPKCCEIIDGTAHWGGGPHDPFLRVLKSHYDDLERRAAVPDIQALAQEQGVRDGNEITRLRTAALIGRRYVENEINILCDGDDIADARKDLAAIDAALAHPAESGGMKKDEVRRAQIERQDERYDRATPSPREQSGAEEDEELLRQFDEEYVKAKALSTRGARHEALLSIVATVRAQVRAAEREAAAVIAEEVAQSHAQEGGEIYIAAIIRDKIREAQP